MENKELLELIEEIKVKKSEGKDLEIKAANINTPNGLRKTLSSFSNQNIGGTILFGIDEDNDFNICGVYDAQDLQKKVNHQAQQMEPEVYPEYTVGLIEDKTVISAEIPSIPYSDRPCFNKNKGLYNGSYKRVGDQDLKMTPFEIFDFQVYRHSKQIDKEEIEDDFELLNQSRLNFFLKQAKQDKVKFAQEYSDDQILKLFNIRRNNLTKAGALIFSDYPQTYFPQLSIHALAYPGTEMGEIGESNERFLDNKDITGSIPEMLDESLEFIKKNIRNKTIIDNNGKRVDRYDYPIEALREAILNALVHRDYSHFSVSRPIKLDIFKDRIEITSPGGLYGYDDVNELGLGNQETRNPNIIKILSILKICENRYSGIPIMKRLMKEYDLPEPKFINTHNEFKVIFYNENYKKEEKKTSSKKATNIIRTDLDILEYCNQPRSRKELINFLGNKKNIVAKRVLPLVRLGKLGITNPEHPKSPYQKFFRVDN